ncbi:MAG: dihydrolipoyl dehydrogenase family protein [Acidobacteriota bacterium]
MSTRYDAIVIGSGAAGGTVASLLKTGGRTVAMIEGGDFGGTCALRGCEPKKVLAETAHAVARVRDMQAQNGVRGDVSIHWPTLAAFKQRSVDSVPPRAEASYESKGIDLYYGRARFTGRDSVLVDDETLEAPHIVIATGSRPRTLDFPGADLVSTSDDFLNLKELPARIAFIGGGFISMEFAHIAAIAGAKATIAVRGERCLKRFELDLVHQLCTATSQLGVDVLYNAPPHSIERTAGGLLLRLGPDGKQSVLADVVIHGAGRTPDLDGLDLAAAEISTQGGNLVLDEYLRTTNPGVYAAGDAAGHFQLTPTAVMEGRIVAANILRGDSLKPDYSIIPSATFTHPTLAGVGLTEEEAKAKGIAFEVKTATSLDWSELTRLGEKHGGYKALMEPSGGRLLGLHYLGEDAEEVINVAALCMRQGLTVAQIMDMVWAYPSFGYTLRYMLG